MVEHVSRNMACRSPPRIRLVRCPKCRKVLTEIADVPMYKCGGCDTILLAKIRKIDANCTSSGSHKAEDAEMNSLDHVSVSKESDCSIDRERIPSSMECSLDASNERDQNISSDFYNKQLGVVNSSDEDQCSSSDRNEPYNRYIEVEQPEICNEVCLSAELLHRGSVELPPIAVANSNLAVTDENSLQVVAKSEADNSNESTFNIRSSRSGYLVATRQSNFTVTAHRPAGESISSDTLLSSPSELLEQYQGIVHHGFDLVRSTDSLETTEFASPRSELSTFDYLSKCPTTRSSHAYDGSVSSYDGVDDLFPDLHIPSLKNAYKAMNSVVAEERFRRDKSSANTYPGLQHQARNFSSVLCSSKNYSRENSKQDQDELLEPARHGHPNRNWPRLERDGYHPQEPFYQRASSAGYESGSSSSQFHDEPHRGPRLYSLGKYTEQERTKLLRMVCELQDQLNKTWYLNGNTNGMVTSGDTWKEKLISRFYDHEALEEGIYQELNHPRYPGRLGQGNKLPQQSKFTRRPFSGESINSSIHQVDHSCSCCHPQEWWCSAQFPPTVVGHNKGFCRGHPCCHNCCNSCTSSPLQYVDSECPTWSCETKSDDKRHKDDETKKYVREKPHLVKRYLRPTAGGAPFVACYSCFNPLQLPADFLLCKRRCHRLRCGSCSEILMFSLKNRTHIVPYTQNTVPPSDQVDASSDAIDKRSPASPSHYNNCPYADPVSCSDDYGLSVCKSCSTDGDPVFLTQCNDPGGNAEGRNTSHALGQRKVIVSKQSDDNLLETYEATVPSSKKVSSELEELLTRGGGSPLHQLMGYSSPSEVIYGARQGTE
ncbi:DUF3133 domain-containing protein [Cephalotus follicularis]|uniref:DUF3133 domain-containing protein n=1 Tax=Cephalotus follicularis TaxID=3775 RepID=A0A1Q3BII0_CEPFO|nr:DUF3133 domain-containing protein [Cephalotus follicularis]